MYAFWCPGHLFGPTINSLLVLWINKQSSTNIHADSCWKCNLLYWIDNEWFIYLSSFGSYSRTMGNYNWHFSSLLSSYSPCISLRRRNFKIAFLDFCHVAISYTSLMFVYFHLLFSRNYFKCLFELLHLIFDMTILPSTDIVMAMSIYPCLCSSSNYNYILCGWVVVRLGVV